MFKDIKIQDLNSYCRTCLVECKASNNRYEVEQLPGAVFRLFKQVTGFPKTHNKFFPKWICDPCFCKIRSFSDFQTMSKNSTKFLEELVKSHNAQNLIKDIDNKDQNESQDEPSNLNSKLSSDSNKEKENQIDEILLEKSPFENVFIQTEINDNFEIAQQIPSTTGALSLKNSRSSDGVDLQDVVNDIKIEENVKGYDFQYDKHDSSFNKQSHLKENEKVVDAALKIVCKYNCDERFSNKKSVFPHYQNKHSPTVVENSLLNAEATSGESSDENLSLLVRFRKDLSKKTCSICNKTYASAAKLRSHMLTHNENDRFKCDLCTQSFQRKIRLREHMRKMHAEKPSEIDCKFRCGKTFLRLQTALAHYRNKHSVKADLSQPTKFLTDLCGGTMVEEEADSSQLSDEINILPNINKANCQICFHNFSSKQKLKVHMRLHDKQHRLKCDHCEKKFNKRSRLESHIEEIHTNSSNEIICKFGCGKVFRREETASNHYYLEHKLPKPAKNRPFLCEECGRCFKRMAHLHKHSFSHAPAEKRPYKCEQCTKYFVSKNNYENHLLRHTGIKNFECSFCGIKKATLSDLKQHLKNHINTKTYSCSICGKSFYRPSKLKNHEQVVHQGIRRFKCSYCDQAFGKSDNLKHHVMRHTGERPHKCQICDRGFIQAVALRLHMKNHAK